MWKDAISNSLIVFRFSWDLVAEARRSRRCTTHKTYKLIYYPMIPTLSFMYPAICLSSHPSWSHTKGKIVFMAAASLNKSPFSWRFEVAKTVDELWITWLCNFRICLLLSLERLKLVFLSVLFSHRGNCSVKPNQNENDIEEPLRSIWSTPCCAARTLEGIVVSTSLLNSLSLDCTYLKIVISWHLATVCCLTLSSPGFFGSSQPGEGGYKVPPPP